MIRTGIKSLVNLENKITNNYSDYNIFIIRVYIVQVTTTSDSVQ